MVTLTKKCKNKILLIIITVSVICIDLIIKHFIKLNKPNLYITPFLSFIYVENRGAGFGILNNSLNLLILIGFVFIITVLFYTPKIILLNKYKIISISLILGGAIGNLISRLKDGFVTDFIDIHISYVHWPTFNVADICLVIGTITYIILNLKKKKN